jgi:hypothetical protein
MRECPCSVPDRDTPSTNAGFQIAGPQGLIVLASLNHASSLLSGEIRGDRGLWS